MPKLTRVDHDPFERGELVSAFIATAPQKEIWLGAWFGGSDANRAFNECLTLQLTGALHHLAFAAAYERLVERHDALRMTFSADGEWCLVGRTSDARLVELDLSAWNESDQAAEIVRLRVAEVTQGFDLIQGPLHRVALLRLSLEQHLLFFSVHHIACDWWSAGVLMQELAALYRRELDSGEPPLPPAPAFMRYALIQTERERGEGASGRAFWLGFLSDYQPRWELPADRSREVQRTYGSRRADMRWDETASRGLGELSRRHACTAVVSWLALLQIWLWRIAGASDVVIGIPSAGQVTRGEPRLVGHCVHLLPIRLKCDAQDTFADLAARAKATLLACLEHPEVTYSAVLAELARVRKPGQLPLVAITVNVDNGLPALDFGALRVSYQTIPRRYEMFELAINVVLGARVCLQLNFNTRLFDETTVRQWMRQLQDLVVLTLTSPQASLSDLCASM